MNQPAQKTFIKLIDNFLKTIEKTGYAVIENAIDTALTQKLLEDSLKKQPNFTRAGIGRKNDRHLNEEIRKDTTLWLTGETQPQADFLSLMMELRLKINQHFYLGLFEYECHYAKYENGAFYKKHLDAFKGKSNRVFTTVFYLNTPPERGELLIYNEASSKILEKIKPKAGTLVLFESERFPHEVLPAKDERYSIAGWFKKSG
jgi:SM-20-related protein